MIEQQKPFEPIPDDCEANKPIAPTGWEAYHGTGNKLTLGPCDRRRADNENSRV